MTTRVPPPTSIAELKPASTCHMKTPFPSLHNHFATFTFLELKFVFQILNLSLIAFSLVRDHHTFQAIGALAFTASACLFVFLNFQNSVLAGLARTKFLGGIVLNLEV